ncbi:MAG: hypothetical protein J6C42_03895, partial [Clostridia bacterium]|nr:hypothetical protein [Clostridia bacterium]
IRIEKTANYTVISNYPLRDSRLSLKACALLCKMLCNTDTWDYSITGMAAMCKDGKSAVSSAMKELEQYGYLVRKQHRNEKGQIVDTEYIIYESPELNVEYMQKQAEISAEPDFFSASEEPPAENPFLGDAEPENDAQINTIPTSTETINTDAISSYPSFSLQNTEDAPPKDVMGYDEACEIIRENIEYDILCERFPKERLDEIVDIAVEIVSIPRAFIRVGDDSYPYALAKDRVLRLEADHIIYILESIDSITHKIHYVKPYLTKTILEAVVSKETHDKNVVNCILNGKEEKR